MRRMMGPVAIALVLAACGSDGEPENGGVSPTVPAVVRPSSPAELAIVEPAAGASVGQDVTVVIDLQEAEIIEEVSTDLDPREGHMHLKLDGETITILGGLEERLADLVGGTLEPGPHLLEAEFVAADHGPFEPRVVATVNFTVEG